MSVFGTEGRGDCHDGSVVRAWAMRIGASTDCVTATELRRRLPRAATADRATRPAAWAA